MTKMRERITVLAFALAVLGFIIGSAFGIGYSWEDCCCDLCRHHNQRRPARRSQRFFDSGAWMVIRNLTIFFVAVFWLATAYWVYKDARRRIEDPWLVAMATVLGLVPPFVGPIIYLFFRPPEYIEDVRERELEIRAMEERLSKRDLHCPVCHAAVEATFLVCPVCTTRLKQACVKCNAPLEALWQICPIAPRRCRSGPARDRRHDRATLDRTAQAGCRV